MMLQSGWSQMVQKVKDRTLYFTFDHTAKPLLCQKIFNICRSGATCLSQHLSSFRLNADCFFHFQFSQARRVAKLMTPPKDITETIPGHFTASDWPEDASQALCVFTSATVKWINMVNSLTVKWEVVILNSSFRLLDSQMTRTTAALMYLSISLNLIDCSFDLIWIYEKNN